MLHKETVTPGTLDLIQTLMQDHQLNSFYLVGGTALSLRIGHRESIDIDLFSSSDFDGDGLAVHLRSSYGADVKRHKGNYVSGSIGEVDFYLARVSIYQANRNNRRHKDDVQSGYIGHEDQCNCE